MNFGTGNTPLSRLIVSVGTGINRVSSGLFGTAPIATKPVQPAPIAIDTGNKGAGLGSPIVRVPIVRAPVTIQKSAPVSYKRYF